MPISCKLPSGYTLDRYQCTEHSETQLEALSELDSAGGGGSLVTTNRVGGCGWSGVDLQLGPLLASGNQSVSTTAGLPTVQKPAACWYDLSRGGRLVIHPYTAGQGLFPATGGHTIRQLFRLTTNTPATIPFYSNSFDIPGDFPACSARQLTPVQRTNTSVLILLMVNASYQKKIQRF